MKKPDPIPPSIVGVVNPGSQCRAHGCMLSTDGKPNKECVLRGCPARDYVDREPVVQAEEEDCEPGD